MSDVAIINPDDNPHAGAVKLTMLLSGTVFTLMMLIGVVLRASQGGWIEMDPNLFYQLLTTHGAGMVGTAGLSGAGIMWYFLARHVPLNGKMYTGFLTLFLIGVVSILVSTFVGHFGGMWTFLFPLPSMSGGAWEPWAAAAFMLGYVFIGVAFLLYYLAVGSALIKNYGSFGRALGWHVAFGKADSSEAPPPTIIAAAATTIFNTMGIVVGAAVLVASLVNLLVPGFEVDALLAKNMIYFFGHVFVNAAIYMAVIAVYELIPQYTGRKWKSSKAFIIAWSAVLLFVIAVYPHHLMQDMVLPAWFIVTGQIISYLSGIPLLAVSAFSMAVYMYGSKFKWDLASSLLVLAMAGWCVGVVPAVIDGMVVVNKVMHNTQWVPGHFHIYLLLGEVGMSFGFMAWLVKSRKAVTKTMSGMDKLLLTCFAAGGAGFTLMFLVSGALSVPRRWAVHAPEWFLQDRIATVFALFVVFSVLTMLLRFATGLGRKTA